MIVYKKKYFIALFFIVSTNFLKSMEHEIFNKEFSMRDLNDFIYSNLTVGNIEQVFPLNFNPKAVDLQGSPSCDTEKKDKKKYKQKTLKPLYLNPLYLKCGVNECDQEISGKGKTRFINNFLSHVAINHCETNIPDLKFMVQYPNSYCMECPNCNRVLRNKTLTMIKSSYKRHFFLKHQSELRSGYQKYIEDKIAKSSKANA